MAAGQRLRQGGNSLTVTSLRCSDCVGASKASVVLSYKSLHKDKLCVRPLCEVSVGGNVPNLSMRLFLASLEYDAFVLS